VGENPEIESGRLVSFYLNFNISYSQGDLRIRIISLPHLRFFLPLLIVLIICAQPPVNFF